MSVRSLILSASLTLALFPAVVLAGPCDAHFTFDGNISDASGNGYDGTLITKGGGPATGIPSFGEGKNGQALLLDGSSAVRAPIDLSKEACPQVTISAWVKFDDHPTKGAQYILSSGRNGPSFSRVSTHFESRSGDQRELVKSALRGGRWEFIAMAVDQELGKMQVYWRQRTFERDMKPVGTREADLWIGAIGDDLRLPVLSGAIDDLRVFGQLLTVDQVKQIQVGSPRQPGSTQIPGDELNPNLGLWTPVDQAAVVNHEEQYSAPGIGDGTAEVGVMPKPMGLAQPPDIGDGYAGANSEQRVMSGQTDSLPGSGNLDSSGDAPTSLMPGGSRGTDLSGNESLQQARDENAPLDITYGSEEEGEAAAAAAEERRSREAAEQEADEQRLRQYVVVYDDDVISYSGISGVRGDYVNQVVFTKSQQLLQHVQTLEENDKPCEVMIDAARPLHGTMARTHGTPRRATINACGDGLPRVGFGVFGNTIDASTYVGPVTSIQTCRPGVGTNPGFGNNRVKGFRAEVRSIEHPSGRYGSNIRTVNFDQKSHCTDWNDWRTCPANTYAIGLRMHFKDGSRLSPKDFLVGVELVCTGVAWEELTAEQGDEG